jgi:two-component system, NtrC family, response regulator AtoC
MLIRILIAVDPSELSRRIERLVRQPDVVVVAGRVSTLWERLSRENHDLVIVSEESLGVEAAVDTIASIRRLPDRPEVIVILGTEEASLRASMQAAGAFATVYRGLDDGELRQSLTALVRRRREGAVARLRGEQRGKRPHLGDFSTHNSTMRQLLDLAQRVAPSDSSLLVVGETGVGKEWLARAIHAAGPRASSPFIGVNCAAIPESLLESELFGHEKGAFTSAIRSRRGYFELAHRGTLFLDEIGDMAMHLQAKLLRVLQERRIQRIGSEEALSVDVRLIAATNRDLEHAIQVKEFRKDLYYRLGVVTLRVPPLRERPEDIPQLVDEYVHLYRGQLGRPVSGVAEEAIRALTAYGWPGNVRELSNVIERAVLLAPGNEITLADLPDTIANPAGEPATQLPAISLWSDDTLSLPLDDARRRLVESFERAYLDHHLRLTNGSIGDTARSAGIDPRTLFNKLKLYRLRKEDYR